MTSIADSAVTIQASSPSVPSTPAWFGDVVLIAHSLRTQNIPSAIAERVRFARRRFGHVRGSLTDVSRAREALPEASNARVARLLPTSTSLCPGRSLARFGRERLPARSTLSRFFAALPPEPLEVLRCRLLDDLLAPPAARGGASRAGGSHREA